MSLLLPSGVNGLADCPHTLHDAILQALHFLGFEELPIEDRPPRKMWLDGKKLERWWTERTRAREERYGGAAAPGEAEGPVQINAAAEGLIIDG